MTLKGRRVVILAEREYEDLELWYPKLRLEEAGVDVVVAGPGEGRYLSKHGYPVDVDRTVGGLRADEFDGVIVPGGWAPDYLRRDRAVTDFVRAMAEGGKLVGAVCHGGSVLVSAGVIRGRRMTSVVAIRDDLVNAGATWIDADVVVDGHLVTSRRPADLPAFLQGILSVLEAEVSPDRSSRMAVDAELVMVRLDDDSFAYMVEMLNRMPGAKGYGEADFDPASADLRRILADFVRESDPRGSLEAEAVTVVDVRGLEDGGYVARGNSRLATVLQGADVPHVGRFV